jgi:D-alanyl-D-alanine carboxypeptidase
MTIEFPNDFGCRWSVLVRDIDTGEELLSHTPDRVLSTASIGKVFLLHRLLREVDEGTRSLEEVVARRPSEKIGGSGIWQLLQQPTFSLYDLGAFIGAVSDNFATNTLARVVGLDAVTEHTRALGYEHSRLNDIIRWPIPPGMAPRLSEGNASELVDFVERVQRGDDLSPASADVLRGWFGAGMDLSMVGSVFDLDGPDHNTFDNGVWFWNKTGTVSTVRADIGVVMSPTRRIAFAVLAQWDRGEDARGPVLETMAEIGLLIGDALGWVDPRPKRRELHASTPLAAPTAAPSLERIQLAAGDARLRDARYLVLDAASGEELLARKPDEPTPTASVMKTLTGTAALHVLGPEHRIPTRVLAGAEPGDIVLVGGGDVTLSRVPSGQPTFYPHPAHLDELAARVRERVGEVTRVVLDDRLFAGAEWHPSWDVEGRAPEGYIPFISALQLDGDRDDPVLDDSPRTDNPVGRLGKHFSALLGGPEVRRAETDERFAGEELARVESAPVEQLVREILRSSDNALSEALGKLVAIARGGDASFASVHRELTAVAAELGLDVSSANIVDGSGLSDENRVTPRTIAELMRRGHRGDGPAALMFERLMRTGSTMAANRFVGANRVVGDAVAAKTGYINSVHSLAGVVRTVGGRELVFAVFGCDLEVPVEPSTRQAVDDLVTRLHLDGDALG